MKLPDTFQSHLHTKGWGRTALRNRKVRAYAPLVIMKTQDFLTLLAMAHSRARKGSLQVHFTLLLLFALLFAVSSSDGGSGRVNADGTIDITISFRFPPTAGDLDTVSNQVRSASMALWDASEGRLRFGNVTLAGGAVNEDLADLWMFAECFRAGTTFWNDGSGLSRPGVHVSQSMCSGGATLAHEFAHLALGLGDEYSEQRRFGACWGYGPCLDAGADTPQNQCIMQNENWTEFCTAGMHDLLIGDGQTCAMNPVPHGCADNCEFFSDVTGLYETTQQQDVSGEACWPRLVRNFPFLAAPAGLPVAAAPGGFVEPNLIDQVNATDTVMLVLDRSGSMLWNTENDSGEVCGDGSDNDGDGMTDETDDCTQTRMAFLKAAARAWLALANGQGVQAGVISFNTSATLDAAFQTVDAANLPALNAAVDGLVANGGTGIGTALDQSALIFDAAGPGLNKTAFLFTDGQNNSGVDPGQAADRLRDRGVRVFTISTGSASDSDELSDIAGRTGGSPMDASSATTLVNAFVQQWARYRNISTLIPQMPYSLNRKNQGADDRKRDPQLWALGREGEVTPPSPERAVGSVFFSINVEPGTERLTLVLAGNMSEMAGFGLHTRLFGPGPSSFDSDVPDPQMRVVRDRFFHLVEIKGPNPGSWTLRIEAGGGAADVQTGNLTIISDNPRVDFFTSLNHSVVANAGDPIKLFATPIYSTTLRDVDSIFAMVKRPDGSFAPLALTSSHSATRQGDYLAEITDTPFAGIYEVRTYMRTGPATYNDPGEPLYDALPPATVAVPVLERTSVEYFFVQCPPLRTEIQKDGVVITWRAVAGGCQLQTAEEITGPWKDLPGGKLIGRDIYELVVKASEGHRFFRLRCGGGPCLNLSSLPVGRTKNPWEFEGHAFDVGDAQGNAWDETGVFERSGHHGLECGQVLRVALPQPCSELELTILSSNDARNEVVGLDAGGRPIVRELSSGPPDVLRTIALNSREGLIHSIVLRSPKAETLLLRLCCK